MFAPNIRGFRGFGKRFLSLDNGALRAEAVKDLKDCADWVVKSGVETRSGWESWAAPTAATWSWPG